MKKAAVVVAVALPALVGLLGLDILLQYNSVGLGVILIMGSVYGLTQSIRYL